MDPSESQTTESERSGERTLGSDPGSHEYPLKSILGGVAEAIRLLDSEWRYASNM